MSLPLAMLLAWTQFILVVYCFPRVPYTRLPFMESNELSSHFWGKTTLAVNDPELEDRDTSRVNQRVAYFLGIG